MKRVINSTARGLFVDDEKASIGIGSLIIFIAMVLVAGIAASVMIQTMNSLEQQAMTTGQETIRDISSGLRVTQESGYSNGTKITQLAIFINTIAGSEGVDLNHAYLSLSNSDAQVILNYTSEVFSSSVSSGLFGTVNSSNLSATTFGILVIRDSDSSCTSTIPVINKNDLVVLLVNTTKCFSGLDKRTKITGSIVPEYGINGMISFTTPSAFVNTIIEL